MECQLEEKKVSKVGTKETSLLIDSDVHPYIVSLNELVPYMDESLQRRMRLGRFQQSHNVKNNYYREFKIPSSHYENIGPLQGMRLDAVPPSGNLPGSDQEYLRSDLLDRTNTTFAILNAGHGTMSAHHNVDLAAEYNSAYNDWLYHEWIIKDKRFKMTILVTPLDPNLAIKEIERVGKREGCVGINLQNINIPLGKRHFYPIYEIAEKYNLPIVLHPDAEGSGEYSPSQAVGPASTYIEWHSSLSLVAQRQIMSLVFEGVFERFPKLKVVFIEYGFSWLPSVMWRMDKNWKGLREEVPWVKKLPSEYVRNNIRLGTQPSEEPFHPKDLIEIIRMAKAEDMLLYSSDYPHWDGDPIDKVFKHFPQDMKNKIFYQNAKDTFHL
ncbi:putative TIM-barrel fold metal-dependent hydrolase [Neobacillus niacini]|uniref:amidohydrolase family protein n=1 Tax=Neobacillus driksii TaxID=3035913 RepID=UPI00278A0095|nr:amidohydrolase family protein [Neobacillus niacini]MDQ0970306.1 putative TIM-barrel fold metal-dependent hydrolase [Neobacillus niacini]